MIIVKITDYFPSKIVLKALDRYAKKVSVCIKPTHAAAQEQQNESDFEILFLFFFSKYESNTFY